VSNVETARFDSLARMLATSGTRRSLVRGLAVLGIGGAVAKPAAVAASTAAGDCTVVMCPPGYAVGCYYDRNGKCIGCKCFKVTTGITGGGLVSTDAGEAHLSLLGTRMPDPDGTDAMLVTGHLRWVDPDWEGGGLTLESIQITGYGPTEGVERGRELSGWLQSSALPAPVPFFLQAVADGGAGSGKDTVSLLVGDAVPADTVAGATPEPVGFSYQAQGTLTSGGLSLLNLGLGGESVPGTPA
jgi:hypothetical protein